MTYKLTTDKRVLRIADGATLPCRFVDGFIFADDWHSPFVIDFAKWIAQGNTPAPADPLVPMAVDTAARDRERDLQKLQKALDDGDQQAFNELALSLLKGE